MTAHRRPLALATLFDVANLTANPDAATRDSYNHPTSQIRRVPLQQFGHAGHLVVDG